MKISLVFAGLLLATSAHARPYLPNMSCASAKNLVDTRGSVVLSTSQHTYDRFVAHQGYCARGEEARPAWVTTRDSHSCFIGYTCSPGDHGGGGGQ